MGNGSCKAFSNTPGQDWDEPTGIQIERKRKNYEEQNGIVLMSPKVRQQFFGAWNPKKEMGGHILLSKRATYLSRERC